MSDKLYVHSGAFLLCDKCVAPVPVPLTVTSQQNVFLPGGLWATEFDELPVLNVPPFGVCAVTHGPCTYAPLPPGWSPVMESVEIGPLGGKALLEDSKIKCVVGGQISIYLTKAAALATLPDVVSQKFDSAYAYLESVGPPFGGMLRDQLGEAKGVWQGALSMGQGLWALAKMKAAFDEKVDSALLFAVQHPVAAAHAVAEGTQKAATAGWQAVTDQDNWLAAASVAENAMPGVLVAKGAVWLSDEQNRAKVGAAYDKAKAWEAGLTDYERSTLMGRAKFEIAALLVPETKLAKAAEVAKLAEGGEAAAAGMRMLGEVRTGAKGAEAAEATGKFEELFAGIMKCLTEGDPVDVASGLRFSQNTDFTLPGPIPLVWTRTWLSISTHQGALGHGWYHAYDLGLTPHPEGGATLRLADGRYAVFTAPAPGQRSFNRRNKLELARDAAGFRVWDLLARVWYVFGLASFDTEAEQRLLAVEDANGGAIRFAYSPTGHLTAITDSVGRVLPCDTDAAGRLLAIHAPDPDQADTTFPLVRYTYDEADDLIAATDALGHAACFTYQGHLMTRETFRSGISFYFEYDGPGPGARCVHTWGDGGIMDTRLQYNSPSHTTVWDSYGHQKEYYHLRGLVIQRQDALGAVQKWRYNQYAELEHIIDPLGHMTRYDYDARGNQVATIYPDETQLTAQFNEQGQLVVETNANKATLRRAYDEQGRMMSRTDWAGATIRYKYDSQSRLSEKIDELGHTTILRYDNHCNLIQEVGPDNSIRSRAYDALGRLTSLTDATGHVQCRRYDRLGQLVQLKGPDGTTHQFDYDADGNLVRAHDGRQEVLLTYNPIGQLARRRQGGAVVQFTYDLQGRLTGLINERDETYQLALDAAGQVVAETGFDGLTRRYERDLAGRPLRIIRPADRTTAFAYDPMGRVTEVVQNEIERTYYRYHADGTLSEANNTTGTVQFERDPLGRVLCEKQQGHTVTSTYDDAGERLTVVSSLGAAFTFERNTGGQVTRATAGTWQSLIERDAEGRELSCLLRGGLRTGWLRDTSGRPTAQHIATGGTHRHRRYHWQEADQLTEIEDSTYGPTKFAYDEVGNLTAATYSDGTHELRQPDNVGNLYRSHERTDRRYGKGGQLREADGTRYRYDEEGNLTRKTMPNGQQWHYTWDGAGQLTQVTRPDGYAVTFQYDALGRRVCKRFRGRVTKWVWDGDQLLHEWTELEVGPGTGAIDDLTTWLFEDESFAPVAKLTSKGAYSVICDHLGTPLGMYDEKGEPTWEMTLDSYGGVRQGRGKPQDCPFRYQGQYEDVETGLYYNRFRYYSPQEGNYLSRDPASLRGGMRLYSYVHNPNSYVDEFGLLCAEVINGELRIVQKFPAGSPEALELESFVKAWNQEIKNAGGNLTRQAVPPPLRNTATNAGNRARRADPHLYANGEVPGHTPDVGWGGQPTGPFIPLTPSVNRYVGGATQAVPAGTTYTSVVIIP